MSFIQDIREKYSRPAVIIIALALLGFILMDALVGRTSLFSGGPSNNVGKVNGERIGITEFDKKVQQQESYMAQQGYPEGEALRSQAIETVWNQEIYRVLMTDETDKLGIQVGKKEINEILFGPDAPEDLKRQFTDPQTGQYNPNEAIRKINEMKRKGTAAEKESFNLYITQLEMQRKFDKYNALLSNSINFPRWLLEKQNIDNSLMGKISMVKESYSSIPDSTVKVSDDEIKNYIDKHKDDFKQEESRSIAYVTFSASPSLADSAAARNSALALKEQFDTTTDINMFLRGEGVSNYYDGHISGKSIQIAMKDSIFKTPVGSVYGPYLDAGNYMLAKVVSSRPMPDTVKVRHILVATMQQDPQTGQTTQIRDTATAYRIADSIQTAIRNGSNFDSLVVKLSDDPGSKDKGGVYESVHSGQMVPEFNEFIFLNKPGSKGIVKTDFGYHYIEVMSHKGSGIGYKVAYVPRPVIASNETDNNASNRANEFAADSRDQKSFDANYDKVLKPLGVNKNVATDIRPNAADLPGLGASRTFVRNIYKAKQGEVLQPERIGTNYVVAVVTEVNEEGTQGVSKARLAVEPLLRKKKQAEMIRKKIGAITTLEAVATVLGKQIESVDSLRMTGTSVSPSLGYEPKVSGAAFNPANKGKVVPEALEGVNGVYVIRVDNVAATAVANANIDEQRRAKSQQAKQQGAMNTSPFTGLRKLAKITDKRADMY
jgi:peptidyl-prolyl cis-trans isomerase D